LRRRTLAVWLILLAAYASTIGMRAFAASEYGGDEPHYLLTAKSIVDDGDIDVLNQFRKRQYRSFYPYELRPQGVLTKGRLNEPHGVGFPLLIAPAYAIGGPHAVEALLAAIAALAGMFAYRLALRMVPDPWAIGATLAVFLSPPFLAYSTAVYPEAAAGCALAGAALLAVRLSERVSRKASFACFTLLAALPWLGAKFVPAGIVVGFFAVQALRRERRSLLAVGGVEVAFFSVALYVGLNEGFYGGATPYAASDQSGTMASALGDYLDRTSRLAGLLVDRQFGVLRWAPVLALALWGLWLIFRSHREGLARVLTEQRFVERIAALCGLVLGVQLLVATFLAPTMFGFWFPGRHLMAALPLAVPLAAWGLRHSPRVGTVLALIGLAGSVWLWIDVRFGHSGLITPLPDAPWGPLVNAFPRYAEGALPYVLTVAAVLALAAVALGRLRADARAARTTG